LEDAQSINQNSRSLLRGAPDRGHASFHRPFKLPPMYDKKLYPQSSIYIID